MTVVTLTSGTTWVAAQALLDKVEAWGAGATGGTVGGGGGAYAVKLNFSVTNGASIPIVIGATSVDTKFNTTDVIAKSGVTGSATGASGAACTPSTGAFSGGAGGASEGGGGGGAGKDGVGLAGTASAGKGGNADNGSGGAGGAGSSGSNGTAGTANVEGGGGGGGSIGANGGAGGAPGGGGGGSFGTAGAGARGQIRITYTASTVFQQAISTAQTQSAVLVGSESYTRLLITTNTQTAARRPTIVSVIRGGVDAQTGARAVQIGWRRGLIDAQAVATQTPHIPPVIASAVDPQSSSRGAMLVAAARAAIDAQAAHLGMVAAHARALSAINGQIAAVQRAITILRSTTVAQSAAVARALAAIRRTASSQTVVRGAAIVSVIRSAIQGQPAAVSRALAIVRSTANAQVADRVSRQVLSRTLSTAGAEIVALSRTYNPAGLNFSEVIAVASASAASTLKAMSWTRGAIDAASSQSVRAVGKSTSVTAAEAISTVRQTLIRRVTTSAQIVARGAVAVAIMRSIVSTEALARMLLVSINRRTTSAFVVSLGQFRAFFRAATVTSAQVVARISSAVRPLIRSALDAGIASLVTAYAPAGLNFIKNLNAVSAEAAAMIRAPFHSAAGAASNAQTLRLIRLTNAIRTIASVQVPTLIRATAMVRATISGEVASRQLTIARGVFSAVSTQVVTLFHLGGRVAATASGGLTHLFKTVSALRSAMSSETATRGPVNVSLHLPADPAQVTTLGVRIGRGLARAVASIQSVAAIPVFNSTHAYTIVAAAQLLNVAALFRTRPWMLSVVSSAAVSVIAWVHQFIPLARRRRVVRLPGPQLAATVPPAARRVVLPLAQVMVALPPSVRRVVVPLEVDDMSDYEITRPEPAYFSPFDPADEETFTFDWSVRGFPNDTIVFASVISVPPGVNFLGPAFIDGQTVEITVGPFTTVPSLQPVQYALRCMAVFQSGRISNYSVPFQVKSL